MAENRAATVFRRAIGASSASGISGAADPAHGASPHVYEQDQHRGGVVTQRAALSRSPERVPAASWSPATRAGCLGRIAERTKLDASLVRRHDLIKEALLRRLPLA